MEQAPTQIRELWFPFALTILHNGKWAKLSLVARSVYPAICAFADFGTRIAYPSVHTIARIAGVSPRSVSTALTELVKAGLLTRDSGKEKAIEDAQARRQAARSGKWPVNRYRIVIWPLATVASVSDTLGNGCQRTPATDDGQSWKRLPINDIQLTTAKRTTTPAGGDEPKDSVLLQDCASELDLRRMGIRDLEELLDRYGADWLRAATEEAVSRNRRSLAYVKGILKRWDAKGRPSRVSKRDEASATARHEKDQTAENGNHILEARMLAEKRLSECAGDEIAEWTRQAEQDANEKKIHRFALKSFIRSRLLVRVAEKYGITGL